MVEVIFALIFGWFGTTDVQQINSADLEARLLDAGYSQAVVDQVQRPGGIVPGNGQDLLSPGGNPNSNDDPGFEQ